MPKLKALLLEHSVFITAQGQVVFGTGFGPKDRRNLLEQLQLAQNDADYSIIANYKIRWESPRSIIRYVHVPGGTLKEVDAARDKLERQLAKRVGVRPRSRRTIERSQAALKSIRKAQKKRAAR